MKILFLGSGEFGLPTLQRLVEKFGDVTVVTSPDRLAGRNRSSTPTAIGKWANDAGLQVIKTDDVNTQACIEKINSLNIDATVVIAFGQKLSEDVIGNRPTINLHASLLPRWRGASPINAAILHGDTCSGISVITLAQIMDAGTVLGKVSTEIGQTETAGELHDRLSLLGPDLVCTVLSGDFVGENQDESKVTYAPKLSRSDATLNLSKDAKTVANTIRGLSPWPGCHVTISGTDCKLLRAIPKNGSGAVGELLEDGTIAVGEGSIEILELKPAGSKTMSWKDFCNGRLVQSGDVCEVLT